MSYEINGNPEQYLFFCTNQQHTPSARRRGVARAILRELEQQAAELGYRTIRAESGNRQPEAVSLYEDAGFYRVPPFGSHAHDPISIFFEKTLSV